MLINVLDIVFKFLSVQTFNVLSRPVIFSPSNFPIYVIHDFLRTFSKNHF